MINDKKSDCCGCTACVQICSHKAITMKDDEEGFQYPLVNNEKCVKCGLCVSSCPINVIDVEKQPPPTRVYAVKLKDAVVRKSSSSGGVFSSFATYFINSNGIVYGAAYDNDFRVRHICICREDEIKKLRGSKYVQSDINGIYSEIKVHLRNGRKVLFSGTPCQVYGLKTFLKKDYSNLYTIDILCHGVPSPKILEDYVKFVKHNSILPIRGLFMKDKTFGWGYQNLRIYYSHHISLFNTKISNLWNRLYYGHCILRPSCYSCKFTSINRVGDISIGDYWNIEKYHPSFFDDKGVSLVLINSSKGLEIWKNTVSNYDFIESEIDKCLQPVLQRPVQSPVDRHRFWSIYHKKGFRGVIRNEYNISIKDRILFILIQIKCIVKKMLPYESSFISWRFWLTHK